MYPIFSFVFPDFHIIKGLLKAPEIARSSKSIEVGNGPKTTSIRAFD